MFGTTLIEYKSPGELETKSKRRQHAAQALRYLRDEHIGANVVILTDGFTWGILRDSESEPVEEQMVLDFGLLLDVPDEERFQWRENSVATAGRVLDLFDTIKYDSVTPTTLMNRLGPTTTQARGVLALLAQTLVSRQPNSRTDILFQQWVALAGVSYGIESATTRWPEPREAILEKLHVVLPDMDYPAAIYVIHTYIAICSKMMAAEALALSGTDPDQRPSQWSSLNDRDFSYKIHQLESGQFASEMRAPRLMGGDLFGWYAEELDGSPPLRDALRNLYGAFSQLAWARLTHATQLTGDLLRDFYLGGVSHFLIRDPVVDQPPLTPAFVALGSLV